jgi:hypothetical protein
MKSSVLLAVLVAAPLVHAQKKQLQPGQWEITVQMEMEGSNVQLPPMTMKKCVTADDAKSPGELFRSRGRHGGDEECQMKEQKAEGNKYAWTVDCGAKGKGSGSVTFEPGKYDGSSSMEMMMEKGVLRKMKMTMKGRRVGECP